MKSNVYSGDRWNLDSTETVATAVEWNKSPTRNKSLTEIQPFSANLSKIVYSFIERFIFCRLVGYFADTNLLILAAICSKLWFVIASIWIKCKVLSNMHCDYFD